MGMRITFRVFDKKGRDVTDNARWHIDQDGDLYRKHSGAYRLMSGYTYKVTAEGQDGRAEKED